jgi:hypothetical protein
LKGTLYGDVSILIAIQKFSEGVPLGCPPRIERGTYLAAGEHANHCAAPYYRFFFTTYQRVD